MALHPGALVAAMLANNETGVLHPVRELCAATRAAKGLFFCDLAQAAGKMPVDVRDLDLDLAALSAVKFGGPQGVGLLYVRKGLALKPLLHGGHQELGLRPGTVNVAGAAALAAALKAALLGLDAQVRDWESAVARLESGRPARLFTGLHVHGKGAERVANTLCASLPGVDRDLLLVRLDQVGLRVSAGAACASGPTSPATCWRPWGPRSSSCAAPCASVLGPDRARARPRRPAPGSAWPWMRSKGPGWPDKVLTDCLCSIFA